MTPPIPERAVLLAAAASPLVPQDGKWHRSDLPAGLSQPVDGDAVARLLGRGLLYLTLDNPDGSDREWIDLSQDGEDVAETLRDALGPERRQILRALDGAGELVRRERPISELEAIDVYADGGVPSETVVEWVRPHRGRAAEPLPGPWGKCTPAGAVAICSGTDLEYLQQLGLVVLLAGGTRALLTGAGRWCAAEGPGGDSKPGADQGALSGGPELETASEGCCGPGVGADIDELEDLLCPLCSCWLGTCDCYLDGDAS